MDLGKDLMLEMYRSMQRIRQFEGKVRDLAIANEIPGFVHVSIGEEASATGVCAALRKTDRITSTHRGHSHLIAKGGTARPHDGRALRQARPATARAKAARCISSISRSASSAPTGSSAPACRSRPARRWPRKFRDATTSPPVSSATAHPTRAPFTNRSISPRSGSCRWSSSAKTTASANSPRWKP